MDGDEATVTMPMGKTPTRFRNREEAGKLLADAVVEQAFDDPVVLGLPRGGVPVAREIAEALDAPLDVLVVRKIGAPRNPEYALGAIGEGGVEVLDEDAVMSLGYRRADLDETIENELAELNRRLQRYRGERKGADVQGRTVIVVDDGVATGRTAEAAARVMRARGAKRVVFAAPVGAPESLDRLKEIYDEVIVLAAPPSFMAVGMWYVDFGQTRDEEVVSILSAHRSGHAA